MRDAVYVPCAACARACGLCMYVNIYTFHFTYCLSTTRMPDTTDAAPYRYEVVVIHNLMIVLLLSIARMLES